MPVRNQPNYRNIHLKTTGLSLRLKGASPEERQILLKHLLITINQVNNVSNLPNSLFYVGTMEKLLIENRCPACVYGDENKKMYLKWFNIENYNSLETLLAISGNGLCRKHGWELSQFGNKLSTLNQFVINKKINELENLKTNFLSDQESVLCKIWPFSIILQKKKKSRLQYSTLKCPLCEAVKQGEQMALLLMADFLKTEKGIEAYRNSPSLCWRHLIGLFCELPSNLILLLSDIHIEQLEKMDRDFEEYFRKTDYRFSNEPKGEEQLAWLKSLRFYVGESLSN